GAHDPPHAHAPTLGRGTDAGPDPPLGGDLRRDPAGAQQRRRPAKDVGAAARTRYRYWPVFVAVSIARPDSLPFPLMSVRMYTIRSPFLPEIRAQSSGLVVLGRSSFSLNSSRHACSMCETRRPCCCWSRNSLSPLA